VKLNYRPEIDGLRAIAVVAVILYHAEFAILDYKIFQGGFIGVDIFFVISGYLITSIILKELDITGTFSFKNFYIRRIRRILPALFLVMLVSFPFAWLYLLPNNFIDYSKSILYSLGFSSNYYFWSLGSTYEDINSLLKPFLHTWSLSVEEQFYIIFPLVLLFAFKYLKKYFASALILGFLLSLIVADFGSKNYPSSTFYFLPTRAWELLVGSILAYFEIRSGHRSQNKTLNLFLPICGLILIIHSIIFFYDQMFHPSFYTLSPVLGICLIIWFSDKNELTTRLLSSKLFVGVGLISYSLYLWHYPILAFDKITEFSQDSIFSKVLVGLSILVLSIISYYLIEKPARHKKNNLKKIIYLILLSLFILIILNLIVIINKGFKERLPNIIISNLVEFNSGKFENLEIDSLGAKTIYLIGDSQMNSLKIDLKNRVLKYDYNLKESIVNECLYFPGFNRVRIKTNKKTKICSNGYFLELEKRLKKEENSILIFGGRFPLYLDKKFFNNNEGGVEGDNLWNYKFISSNKFRDIRHSFKDSVLELSKKNKIILVYPIPETGWHIPQKIFNQGSKEIISTSFQLYSERSKSSFELLNSIKGKNIHRVYSHKAFCNTIIKDRCIVNDKKNIFYMDTNHPSIKGAEMINNLLIQKIKEIE
jgi:peptidoglycan/LPS O-acetylase OafA/YrhL